MSEASELTSVSRAKLVESADVFMHGSGYDLLPKQCSPEHAKANDSAEPDEGVRGHLSEEPVLPVLS